MYMYEKSNESSVIINVCILQKMQHSIIICLHLTLSLSYFLQIVNFTSFSTLLQITKMIFEKVGFNNVAYTVFSHCTGSVS